MKCTEDHYQSVHRQKTDHLQDLTREIIAIYNDPCKNVCGLENLSLGVVNVVQ